MSTIVVAGTGYVGLSVATLLAQHNRVIAVDILPEKVKMINERRSPIADRGIEEAFATLPLDLYATTDARSAYREAEYVIVATPTDYDTKKNFFNTSAVESVIDEALEIKPDVKIIIKSTIPVGFTERIRAEKKCKNIHFSPEFLREGHALEDNLYPSRIIVGADIGDPEQLATAEHFISLLKQGARKTEIASLVMGLTESEAVKLFANTYLALRVGYFNELDTYAEMKQLNSFDIIRGVCLDPRIGEHYNNPSFGYGGYCLPKDTKQLLANYNDVPENLIQAIVQSNRTRKDFIASQIYKYASERCADPANLTVGIFRLAMKTGSDNFRQSSILGVMERLHAKGVKLLVYEPSLSGEVFRDAALVNDLEEFKKKSDLIVTNRYCEELREVEDKVYTRDLYHRD